MTGLTTLESDEALHLLEEIYQKLNQIPSDNIMQSLAIKLNIGIELVQDWFQWRTLHNGPHPISCQSQSTQPSQQWDLLNQLEFLQKQKIVQMIKEGVETLSIQDLSCQFGVDAVDIANEALSDIQDIAEVKSRLAHALVGQALLQQQYIQQNKVVVHLQSLLLNANNLLIQMSTRNQTLEHEMKRMEQTIHSYWTSLQKGVMFDTDTIYKDIENTSSSHSISGGSISSNGDITEELLNFCASQEGENDEI
ncbi:hypothetical protein MP228_003076 [Amoeboaphelidium protococcarum]|nr:hypothetical protein MP228_003076 [Amoeboaphelidium protococcarum]